MIISGFPGIGKTHFYNNYPQRNTVDSDSSKFSWIRDGERHPDFPQNYMENIRRMKEITEYVFVSSHKEVRDALVEAGFHFTLVYPDFAHKGEYLERFYERGSPESFVRLIDKNWENFLVELDEQEGCDKIVLGAGQYLSDVL